VLWPGSTTSREVRLHPLPLQDTFSYHAHILYISATNLSPRTASLLPQRRERQHMRIISSLRVTASINLNVETFARSQLDLVTSALVNSDYCSLPVTRKSCHIISIDEPDLWPRYLYCSFSFAVASQYGRRDIGRLEDVSGPMLPYKTLAAVCFEGWTLLHHDISTALGVLLYPLTDFCNVRSGLELHLSLKEEDKRRKRGHTYIRLRRSLPP
jgi:hypothetical protein